MEPLNEGTVWMSDYWYLGNYNLFRNFKINPTEALIEGREHCASNIFGVFSTHKKS